MCVGPRDTVLPGTRSPRCFCLALTLRINYIRAAAAVLSVETTEAIKLRFRGTRCRCLCRCRIICSYSPIIVFLIMYGADEAGGYERIEEIFVILILSICWSTEESCENYHRLRL